MRLVTATQMADIKELWSRLESGNSSLFSTAQWLLATEHSSPDREYAVVLGGDGTPLAAGAAFLSTGADGDAYRYGERLLAPLGLPSPPSAYPAVLAGARSGTWADLMLAGPADGVTRRRLAERIWQWLHDQADHWNVTGMACMYLWSAAELKLLEPVTGPPVLTDLGSRFPVGHCRTYDDYLRSLPARRRASIRREERAFARVGHQVRIRRYSEVAEACGPLLGQLMRKYGHQASDPEMTAALTSKIPFMDDRSVMFTALDESGRLIGFAHCIEHGQSLYLRVCGFDYPRLRGAYEYPNVCYYAPIRYAIDRGITEIIAGTHSLEAKILRGAEPVPLWSLVSVARQAPAPEAIRAHNSRLRASWAARLGQSSTGEPARAGLLRALAGAEPGWFGRMEEVA